MNIKKMQLHSIEQLLQKFSLTETEKKLFLTGITLGPATVIQLAQNSDIVRVTAHHAIQAMIESGLFLQTYYGKKHLYYPNNYDGLRLLLEEKKFELRQLEQELESNKSVFDALIHHRHTQPNTRIFQGIEGINTTLLEMARDKKDISIMYDSHSLVKLIDDKLFHRSYNERSKKNIKTRLIAPIGFRDFWHLERKEDYIVLIKTINPLQLFAGGIEIWGDKVALHCYIEGLVTTTILQNEQIAQILLFMYESTWQGANDYHEQFLLV